MLVINDLNVKYNSTPVLCGLNLSLAGNSIHGMMGLNGAGKTTLLNTVYGNLPYEGSISFRDGALRKNMIAYLEAENYFYSNITGYDYLRLFAYYNKDADIERLNSLFNLPLKQFADSYSTGMKRKLALMGTLILNKDVILLDEPFNGIDVESIYVLSEIIKKLRHPDRVILVTSHIPSTLTGICDEIHFLNEGRIANSYQSDAFPSLETDLQSIIRNKYPSI
jgi:ABC-2 type transport system ATP-binding protein